MTINNTKTWGIDQEKIRCIVVLILADLSPMNHLVTHHPCFYPATSTSIVSGQSIGNNGPQQGDNSAQSWLKLIMLLTACVKGAFAA